MASLLMEKYTGLTLDKYAHLTDWQLYWVYCKPAIDRQAKVDKPNDSKDSGMTPQELFRYVWTSGIGGRPVLTEEEVRAKWEKDYPDEPWEVELEWMPSEEEWAALEV